jgi:hypothetical protein
MALSNETLHILRRLLPRRAVDVLAAELAAAGGLGAADRAVLDLLATVSPGELRLLKPDNSGAGLYLNDTGAIYAWSDGDPNIWAFTLAGGLHPEIGEPVFQIHGDGSHRWGDGTADQDTILRRAAPGGWSLPGWDAIGSLRLVGDYAFGVEVDSDAGPWTYVQPADQGIGAFEAWAAIDTADPIAFKAGLVTDDGGGRFQIRSDGAHSWGDGTNPLDVKLERDAANELKLSSPVAPGVATYLAFATDDGWVGVESVAPGLTLSSYMGPGYFSAFTSQEFADADNDPVYSSRFGAAGEVDFLIRRKGDICWGDHSGVSDAILKRESAGSLELVPFSGASDIVLHSPNGTRYRVSVGDTGTLSAVAA